MNERSTKRSLRFLKAVAANRPQPPAGSFYLSIFGLGACLIAAFDANELSYWLTGLSLIALGVPGWLKYARRLKRLYALHRDLKEGTAVLLEPAHQNAMGYEAHESIEMLPNSKLVWREGDKPALWRRAV